LFAVDHADDRKPDTRGRTTLGESSENPVEGGSVRGNGGVGSNQELARSIVIDPHIPHAIHRLAVILDERQLAPTDDPSLVSALRGLFVCGVLLPGVDGEVAGLYAFGAPHPFARILRLHYPPVISRRLRRSLGD